MSLSDRIRAGAEAAPWVVEEVKVLEAERDEYSRAMIVEESRANALMRERDEARAEVERLRRVLAANEKTGGEQR
jgi:hypothetical protein